MAEVQFQSRDEAKRARQLEEARKAGTAPAEKDEEGKDINPHIPQYISKAPWYLNQTVPGLKHQRVHEAPKQSIDLWYERGITKIKPEKFRKGACENCGALTHKAKECVERPRKLGAKYNGKDLCPDEYLVPELDLGFDGKRDRWAGYDPDEYKDVIHDYEVAEAERKRLKALELHKEMGSKDNSVAKKLKSKDDNLTNTQIAESAASVDDSGTDSDSDYESVGSDVEDVRVRDFDKTSAPMGSKDDNTRTTTRNLRIREDTAKYLYNLDLSSAFYDPKSRSMRSNPLSHLKPEEQIFAGDNAMRNSGDSEKSRVLEVFAWEAYKHGSNVHFNAQPTQLEKMYQEYKEKKKNFEEEKKNKILEKYGGREHMNVPKDILYSQSENYVEYTADGIARKARQRALIKSKYEEDVFYGGHTAVWGSWYDMESGLWGFACCHQLERLLDCMSNPLYTNGREEDKNRNSSTSAYISNSEASSNFIIEGKGTLLPRENETREVFCP